MPRWYKVLRYGLAMATIYSHPQNREGKKRLEIGITQKYIRSGTNRDLYKRSFYYLRRVW
jgi:hypothetical protein